MQKLYLLPTPTSPEINFSPEDRIFSLRGKSSPEDVRELYYPVIEWFRQYIDSLIDDNSKYFSTASPLRFQVDLEYFNSSSAKFLYDLFLELKRLMDARIPVVIEWYYYEEDIDMKEAGSDLALLAEMEFFYIAKTR